MNPESTSSMAERVGQAIADEVIKRESINADEWPIIARAAIAAMREPTERMVEAGESADSVGMGAPRDVWPAMIDAALKD